MELYSIYEVDCYRCGEKVRTLGKHATCQKCGLEIELESWQIRHTLTGEGLLIENSQVKKVTPGPIALNVDTSDRRK